MAEPALLARNRLNAFLASLGALLLTGCNAALGLRIAEALSPPAYADPVPRMVCRMVLVLLCVPACAPQRSESAICRTLYAEARTAHDSLEVSMHRPYHGGVTCAQFRNRAPAQVER